MVQLLSILATGLAVLSPSLAAPLGTNNKAMVPRTTNSTTNVRAVYFMTNEAPDNFVVALRVASDGTLSDGSLTSTGGAGASGIDGATGAPAAPDALFSQGSVKVAGNVS